VRQSAFLTTRRRIEGQIATSLRSSRRRRIGLCEPPLQVSRKSWSCEKGARHVVTSFCIIYELNSRETASFLAVTRASSLRAKCGNLPVNLVVNKEAGGFKQGDRFVPRRSLRSSRWRAFCRCERSAAICL